MPAVTPWFVGAQVPLTFLLTDTLGVPQSAVGGLVKIACTVYLPDGTTANPRSPDLPMGPYAAIFTTTRSPVTTSSCGSPPTPRTPARSATPSRSRPARTPRSCRWPRRRGSCTRPRRRRTTRRSRVTTRRPRRGSVVCGPVVADHRRAAQPGSIQATPKPPVISLLPWTTFPPGMASLGIPLPVPASPMFPCMVFGVPYPPASCTPTRRRASVTHTSGLPFIYGSYMWQYKAGRPVIPGHLRGGEDRPKASVDGRGRGHRDRDRGPATR